MLLKGDQLLKILNQAKAEGWAVGAFNTGDYDTTEIILDAAEETGTPVMLQTGDFFNPQAPESSRMTQAQAERFTRYLRNRAEMTTVPVAIHLDHCPTFEGCVRAIQYGATSVMLDASQKPFDENAALTNKVKEICRATNVALEAEIGHVGGHPNSHGVIYTDVEGAKAFYDATGVDMLAVSIGTVHGFYASEPVLNYERTAELNAAIPVPLVMHGSSGLAPDQFIDAVKAGISKINFATYLQLTGGQAIADFLAANPVRPRMGALTGAAHKAGVEYLKAHIGYFGTKQVTL